MAIPWVWAVLVTAQASAQVVEFKGGTSSLLGVTGGSLHLHGAGYEGRIGIGFQDEHRRPRVGLSLQAPFRGFTWQLGDQSIPLVLPTDVFSRSYYFLARGLGATRKTSQSELFVYGGATSAGFYTPFFQAGAARSPTLALFYDRQLTPSVRAVSRNILSARRTFVQGLELTPRPSLRLGLAGGVGSDQPFAAGSLDFETSRLKLLFAYGRAGDGFKRLPAEGFATAEADHESVQLQLTPTPALRLTLRRQHYLSPLGNWNAARSTVNGLAVGSTIRGVQTQGSLFLSESPFGRSRAYSVGASRPLTGWLSAAASYFRSRSPNGSVGQTFVLQLREMLALRLSLTQVVTWGHGQTTAVWGGHLVSNHLAVGVDYQTIFLPVALAGQSQFRQVMLVDLHIPLPRGLQMSATTHLDPSGQVRYTAFASGFAYGRFVDPGAGATWLHAPDKYLVRGRVVDTTGKAVAGAALRIDGVLVFSDSHGAFELRRTRAKDCALEVALDQFMFPGTYEVVSAPVTVRSASQKNAPEARVVLRRVQ